MSRVYEKFWNFEYIIYSWQRWFPPNFRIFGRLRPILAQSILAHHFLKNQWYLWWLMRENLCLNGIFEKGWITEEAGIFECVPQQHTTFWESCWVSTVKCCYVLGGEFARMAGMLPNLKPSRFKFIHCICSHPFGTIKIRN